MEFRIWILFQVWFLLLLLFLICFVLSANRCLICSKERKRKRFVVLISKFKELKTKKLKKPTNVFFVRDKLKDILICATEAQKLDWNCCFVLIEKEREKKKMFFFSKAQ